MHLNVEIKAKCSNPGIVREVLLAAGADFKGIDTQEDTYLNVAEGRLKLRLGPIENSLIYYNRADDAGPKTSEVTMAELSDGASLKQVLSKALGVKVVVTKVREIFFIENVKFHLDVVPELGNFVEIEAIDKDGTIGKERLWEQCHYYVSLFNIREEDFVRESYSDLLIKLI